MSGSRIWPRTIGGLKLETFNATAVEEIATASCLQLPIVGDPAVVADDLNTVSTDLLLCLTANPSGAKEEAEARSIAKLCSDLRAAFRPSRRRMARKLGLDPDAVSAMLETMFQVEEAALQRAEPPRHRKNAKRPAAEGDWLKGMMSAYRRCFGSVPTVKRNRETAGSERDGGFARFTAAAAARLLADTRGTDPPAGWRPALLRFSTAKKAAGRLERQRQFQE